MTSQLVRRLAAARLFSPTFALGRPFLFWQDTCPMSMRSNRPRIWRQGDVFIVATGALPAGLKPHRPVLAEGEVTGHAHRLQGGADAQVWSSGAELYLEVSGAEATITHDEHHPVTLPQGAYEIRIQREYHPKEIRRVVD